MNESVPLVPGVWRAVDVITKTEPTESFPLNVGDQKSPSVIQGQSSGRGFEGTLKYFAHLHVIFFWSTQDFFAGKRGEWPKWPNGKYASAPSPNPPFSCSSSEIFTGRCSPALPTTTRGCGTKPRRSDNFSVTF